VGNKRRPDGFWAEMSDEEITEAIRKDFQHFSPLQLREASDILYKESLKRNILRSLEDEGVIIRTNRRIGDPLKFFRRNYAGREISRGELRKEDPGLYSALVKKSLIDGAIPEKTKNKRRRKRRKWSERNPLSYYQQYYAGTTLSRGQLQKKDPGLYGALLAAGLLEKLSFERRRRNPRNWSTTDPLLYFQENYRELNPGRKQLQKIDGGLYKELHRRNLLTQAFPPEQDHLDEFVRRYETED
jgi:hypothetical protein